MHVSLDLPDRQSGLDASILRQFTDIQRQLMGLVKEHATSKRELSAMMLEGMAEQRDSLVRAMERLLAIVGHSLTSPSASTGKRLREPQERAMKISVRPLMNRFDSLESALVKGLHRSRNRTFGSNY